MLNTKNTWFNMNKGTLERLKKTLLEMTYKDEFAALPLNAIIKVIDTSILEVFRLQDLCDKMESTVDELKARSFALESALKEELEKTKEKSE
jgi:hypothetical protein